MTIHAARDHEQLRFDYLDRGGQTTVRRVEPHRLVYTGRRWYLLAWDTDRDDWRTFRADRIRPRSPNGARFSPREPPDGDAAAHVLRGLGWLAWKYRARVRFFASAEVVADRVPTGAGMLEASTSRPACCRPGRTRSTISPITWAGSTSPFNVLEPPELRVLLRDLADRYATAAR